MIGMILVAVLIVTGACLGFTAAQQEAELSELRRINQEHAITHMHNMQRIIQMQKQIDALHESLDNVYTGGQKNGNITRTAGNEGQDIG